MSLNISQEEEIGMLKEQLAQCTFALGAATVAIMRFAEVRRLDQHSGNFEIFDCLFCLTATRTDPPNAVDGLGHRAGCLAKKALDEIEKAMRVCP